MKMKTNDEVKEYAESLIGTCQNLEDDFLDLPLEQCFLMDEIVMCCEACGWWVASEDIGENGDCLECENDG